MGAAGRLGSKLRPGSRRALRVSVDDQDSLASFASFSRETNRRRALSRTAFLPYQCSDHADVLAPRRLDGQPFGSLDA